MGRIIFFAGIAGTVCGFCVIVYQGLMYLMHNTWNQYTVMTLIENGPQSLWELVGSCPAVANMLGSCPLFMSLIILGCILMLIGSGLENRYHS